MGRQCRDVAVLLTVSILWSVSNRVARSVREPHFGACPGMFVVRLVGGDGLEPPTLSV